MVLSSATNFKSSEINKGESMRDMEDNGDYQGMLEAQVMNAINFGKNVKNKILKEKNE